MEEELQEQSLDGKAWWSSPHLARVKANRVHLAHKSLAEEKENSVILALHSVTGFVSHRHECSRSPHTQVRFPAPFPLPRGKLLLTQNQPLLGGTAVLKGPYVLEAAHNYPIIPEPLRGEKGEVRAFKGQQPPGSITGRLTQLPFSGQPSKSQGCRRGSFALGLGEQPLFLSQFRLRIPTTETKTKVHDH